MFCTRCGAQFDDSPAFCPKCGAPAAFGAGLAPLAEGISPRSRTATLLLALVLGQFGVHRFYAGRNVTAGIMLVLGGTSLIVAVGMIMLTNGVDWEDPPPAWLLWLIGIDAVLVIVVKVWSLIDAVLAVAGIFKDSQGRAIRKW